MFRANKYILVGIAAISLSACTTGREVDMDVEKPQGAQVDLQTGNIYNDYGDIDPIVAANMVSPAGVEIYPLDGAAPQLRSQNFTPHNQTGQNPVIGNAQVEIFPIGQPAIQFAPTTAYRGAPLANVESAQGYSAAPSPYQNEPVQNTMLPPADALATIYFDKNSARLSEDNISVITGITQHYNPNEGLVLSVEGHASDASDEADPARRKEMNLKISMERAYAVARALMYSGVPSDAIRTLARGEDKYASGSLSADNESISRRVDIVKVTR